jgi:hypothetical protein
MERAGMARDRLFAALIAVGLLGAGPGTDGILAPHEQPAADAARLQVLASIELPLGFAPAPLIASRVSHMFSKPHAIFAAARLSMTRGAGKRCWRRVRWPALNGYVDYAQLCREVTQLVDCFVIVGVNRYAEQIFCHRFLLTPSCWCAMGTDMVSSVSF